MAIDEKVCPNCGKRRVLIDVSYTPLIGAITYIKKIYGCVFCDWRSDKTFKGDS